VTDERLPLSLFVRPPIPGTVKTRLIPALGAAGAAELYRAFLTDTLSTCQGVDAISLQLWIAGDVDDPYISGLSSELPRIPQPDIDLGGRMASALSFMIESDGAGLVLGTDAPSMPASHLTAAVKALEAADVVLGPSADGGFYLVGARGSVPAIFDGVRYSTQYALTDTLERAAAASADVALIPPWYDVDTPADLRLLRTQLAIDPSRARATAAFLELPQRPVAIRGGCGSADCRPAGAASWTHQRGPR
jgi:rSAM/selenodomain-associated transferase 1